MRSGDSPTKVRGKAARRELTQILDTSGEVRPSTSDLGGKKLSPLTELQRSPKAMFGPSRRP